MLSVIECELQEDSDEINRRVYEARGIVTIRLVDGLIKTIHARQISKTEYVMETELKDYARDIRAAWGLIHDIEKRGLRWYMKTLHDGKKEFVIYKPEPVEQKERWDIAAIETGFHPCVAICRAWLALFEDQNAPNPGDRGSATNPGA